LDKCINGLGLVSGRTKPTDQMKRAKCLNRHAKLVEIRR
jgi:hypothetical protein